jgi:nucleoside-diphosphate-sugar epimerase
MNRVDAAVPAGVAELEELLTRPVPGVIETLGRHGGPVAVLGAGGRLGGCIALMARRAFDALGRRDPVFAVSRFSDPVRRACLAGRGIETVACDLLNAEAVRLLPGAGSVVLAVGAAPDGEQPPERLWAAHVLAPAGAARRFTGARLVLLSDIRVYAAVPPGAAAPDESAACAPDGEYAAACLARERLTAFGASCAAAALTVLRLGPVAELRHGPPAEVARRVFRSEPVDVSLPSGPCLWQGDACARALQALNAAEPAGAVFNVCGSSSPSRSELARRFGSLLGRAPTVVGREPPLSHRANPTRADSRFGAPAVGADLLLTWVAEWTRAQS